MNKELHLDLSLFPKELNLILLIVRSRKEQDLVHALHKEELEDFDWGLFLELARHHRLFPLLYTKIRKVDPSVIPAYVIDYLRKDYQANTFKMLTLCSEMDQIFRLFSQASIRCLSLKGPVLAADLYGDLSLRTSGDLDLLIPLADLDQAEELLVEAGYEKMEAPDMTLNDWKWRHHHVTFYHAAKKMTLEIHWRLSPGPGKEPDFDFLWARRRCSSVTQEPVYYLGREDLFLFLTAHGARHGWSRLRWLMDISLLVHQELDSKALIYLLKQNGQLHTGAQALVLASELLRTPIPDGLRKTTSHKRAWQLAEEALFYLRRMVNLHNKPVPEDVSKYHKGHLFSLMSGQQKILFVLSFLYPYPEDIAIVKLPKSLHFLYFPLRPVLWMWRKTKKPAIS
ncbi:nucleotidyltransferase family protein [Paenibacillus aurantius]|uniref:Nucleotidyltransferase family protein n=1 Tax=Paenibacillus aurantius TaxID=2918900 RepID=A0AA96LF26_9BACL|nr:nucleotidyltransferase family protein [Paenibacillus aurantius]WNQ12682.1 nucleotidyltransferase family protein [Paenibacillus aurantius]